MFVVVRITVDGVRRSYAFPSERKARWYINDNADGRTLFVLYDAEGELVIESRFPVLMVA